MLPCGETHTVQHTGQGKASFPLRVPLFCPEHDGLRCLLKCSWPFLIRDVRSAGARALGICRIGKEFACCYILVASTMVGPVVPGEFISSCGSRLSGDPVWGTRTVWTRWFGLYDQDWPSERKITPSLLTSACRSPQTSYSLLWREDLSAARSVVLPQALTLVKNTHYTTLNLSTAFLAVDSCKGAAGSVHENKVCCAGKSLKTYL